MEVLIKEYKKELESLQPQELKDFIKHFKELESYSLRESFLKEFFCKELIKVFVKEEFGKLFYLDAQAKYIKEKLNLSDFDTLKTLVYCYNTNSREFIKKLEEEKLREDLINKGFEECDLYHKEDLIKLDGLKVVCVFDRDKIGLMGSFTEKQEHEGKFKFDEPQQALFFLPKRHTRTGQILRNKFYYKVVK